MSKYRIAFNTNRLLTQEEIKKYNIDDDPEKQYTYYIWDSVKEDTYGHQLTRFTAYFLTLFQPGLVSDFKGFGYNENDWDQSESIEIDQKQSQEIMKKWETIQKQINQCKTLILCKNGHKLNLAWIQDPADHNTKNCPLCEFYNPVGTIDSYRMRDIVHSFVNTHQTTSDQ